MKLKRLLIFFLFIITVAGLVFIFASRKGNKGEKTKKLFFQKEEKSQETTPVSISGTAVFVPYWNIAGELAESSYDRLLYFGITPTVEGIDTEDLGYQNLPFFQEAAGDKKTLLTLRMINADINFSILDNTDSQKKIIKETLTTAKDYGFSGIVLDLELFSLFDEGIPRQITDFVQAFYTDAKNADMDFAMTIYGDTIYRKRPFDLEALSKHTDEMMIMAYDFHKARGEPGPNFPYEGKSKFGYDFKQMTQDMLKLVPKNKLTVIFGMFGYDWTVDETKRPLRQADPLSTNEIREKYVKNCERENCVVLRDKTSQELEVNFVDDQVKNHIIWFEDEVSVEIKQKFLEENGVGSIAYWAYGYF